MTDLYRHFDADDTLLYVGVSLSCVARLAQHRKKSGWYGEIATITIEKFSTRERAIKAERAAIREENPKHNRRSKFAPTHEESTRLRMIWQNGGYYTNTALARMSDVYGKPVKRMAAYRVFGKRGMRA